MSGLIGMAKMSGQGKEMEKAGDQVVDTTLSLYKMADSISNITDEEKALVKKGKIGLQMNIPDEKFIIKLEFPFSDPEQISKLDKLSSRVIQQTLKKQLAGALQIQLQACPAQMIFRKLLLKIILSLPIQKIQSKRNSLKKSMPMLKTIKACNR